MLTIDGGQGEGGGQILRTSLSLAALTGRSLRLVNIRAGRSKPGLRPQHLTAVRAAAAICGADLVGDTVNSQNLTFTPTHPPQGGRYEFDVTTAAGGHSAGAVTLIAQTLLWPLLFAAAPAEVILRGGTQVPFSPPFHYLAEVARPAFARLGASFSVNLLAWGWMAAGGGAIQLKTTPLTGLAAATFTPEPAEQVGGIAAVTNLPAHIAQRMANRAQNSLRARGLQPAIQAERARGAGPGAGICLWLPGAGFSALGRKGLPADKVADAAVAQLDAFRENQAAVDPHLADQLLLPTALASGTSHFTTSELTQHTLTQARLLRRWLDVTIDVAGREGQPGQVTVWGTGAAAPPKS